MYLKDYLNQFEGKKIKMFVDMDGVIVDYVVGSTDDFDKRRPLYTSISKIQEIYEAGNVELYILSITRMNKGLEEKNIWLDNYAPMFKKENRVIISREANDFKASAELKAEYISNLERDGSVFIVIDDDPRVLKAIKDSNKDVALLKDTALVD